MCGDGEVYCQWETCCNCVRRIMLGDMAGYWEKNVGSVTMFFFFLVANTWLSEEAFIIKKDILDHLTSQGQ